MTAACTVVRSGPRLERAAETLDGLCRRYRSIRLADAGMWTNQNLCFARGLGDMLRLAWVILQGAIERRESRGAHYRTDYPRRDDERFLRTTVAAYDPATGRPVIWFEPVETGLIPPRARTYGRAEPARAV
jgi:succinate dehydrogenase / fumarate reductase flavoprotein subunit